MNLLISLSFMFLLLTVNAQATIIILKDGHTITGTIIQQDKNKVIVNVEGTTLTYYKDGIASMKEEPLIKINNATGLGTDKEKLVEEYLSLNQSPHALILDWMILNRLPDDKRQIIFSILNKKENFIALTRIRKKRMMECLSSDELKAAINFFSSPIGRKFHKDFLKYSWLSRNDVDSLFNQELKDVIDTGN